MSRVVTEWQTFPTLNIIPPFNTRTLVANKEYHSCHHLIYKMCCLYLCFRMSIIYMYLHIEGWSFSANVWYWYWIYIYTYNHSVPITTTVVILIPTPIDTTYILNICER